MAQFMGQSGYLHPSSPIGILVQGGLQDMASSMVHGPSLASSMVHGPWNELHHWND